MRKDKIWSYQGLTYKRCSEFCTKRNTQLDASTKIITEWDFLRKERYYTVRCSSGTSINMNILVYRENYIEVIPTDNNLKQKRQTILCPFYFEYLKKDVRRAALVNEDTIYCFKAPIYVKESGEIYSTLNNAVEFSKNFFHNRKSYIYNYKRKALDNILRQIDGEGFKGEDCVICDNSYIHKNQNSIFPKLHKHFIEDHIYRNTFPKVIYRATPTASGRGIGSPDHFGFAYCDAFIKYSDYINEYLRVNSREWKHILEPAKTEEERINNIDILLSSKESIPNAQRALNGDIPHYRVETLLEFMVSYNILLYSGLL